MWTREQAPKGELKDVSKLANLASAPAPINAAPATVPARRVAAMGSSLVFKGELSGEEDLLIEGRVEGKISVPGHLVTIGAQARILAEVSAKGVIIQGSVTGNVTATDRFEIKAGGVMTGDVTSAKVVMAEGSEFSGRVDMRRAGESRIEGKKESKKDMRLEQLAV